MNCITPEQIKFLEFYSSKHNKPDQKFANIMDQFETERFKGSTIEPGFLCLEYGNKIYNFIDTPGKPDYLDKTVMKLLSSADVLLLLVDYETANKPDFEFP